MIFWHSSIIYPITFFPQKTLLNDLEQASMNENSSNSSNQMSELTNELSTANLYYIDQLYAQYLLDKNSVEPKWQRYFENIENTGKGVDDNHINKQIYVVQLINTYRTLGHKLAKLSPIEIRKSTFDVSQIQLEKHNLSQSDLDDVFDTASFGTTDKLTLREILEKLNKIYCNHIGAEYMHISDVEARLWVQNYLETKTIDDVVDDEFRIKILEQIINAQQFEEYIHRKFPGQKRFSLEGGEAIIPSLDYLIEYAGNIDAREVILGMAHRGRLNVMVNIAGMEPQYIFDIYSGISKKSDTYAGDVKYHLGFSSTFETKNGNPIHVALGFNPSHLEIISPVILGSTRSRQEYNNDTSKNKFIPVVIHGDASFIGQGVVMETLQMSQTRGFTVGGTIHIIINNQIGFTTSNPADVGSQSYCSDAGKIINAPIFHVNLDDPEALIYITKLALDYRNTFKKDVLIDAVCYRRLGHNESDEPRATQPMMYKVIDKKPRPTELYSKQLIEKNIVTQDQINGMIDQTLETLKKGEQLKKTNPSFDSEMKQDWQKHIGGEFNQSVKTSISKTELEEIGEKITTYPSDFELHRTVSKVIESRKKMVGGEALVDWGCAEALAFGSLLKDGYTVRLSGQDSGRGTFSHRHAVLHNQKTGNAYIPLQNLDKDQAQFLVTDALLSEEAVLAYEYGYSTHNPNSLVIWEAQFGDFANVAQNVIDQFISAGEEKWGRCSGLVLFLPHGYEGQGAEHSSARLERFLALCATKNMYVCYPSTSGQLFHLLRRQMLRATRKPLIVMTPKSLLRKEVSSSSLDIFVQGKFQSVITDKAVESPEKIKRVVFCTGKVYYDLAEKRNELKLNHIAINRIEELYPFPTNQFKKVMALYKNVKEVVWAQEEPENQGALNYLKYYLSRHVPNNIVVYYLGRPRMAAPAVGSYNVHQKQLDQLLDKALVKAVPRKKLILTEAIESND